MSTLLGLGSFRFQVTPLNIQELDNAFPVRWAPQNRVGGRPGMQHFGPDVETMTLDGVMYPSHVLFAGAEQRFEELRSPTNTSRPHRLASGNGRHYGLWVITSTNRKGSFLNPDGSFRKLEFSIDISHFGWGKTGGGGFSLF